MIAVHLAFTVAEGDDPARTLELESITIKIERGDDPDGHLLGLMTRERLDTFLRFYAKPDAVFDDIDEAYSQLARFAFVTSMCERRLEVLEIAARDQVGMGWGTIASALEESRSTVRDRIMRRRQQLAEGGVWYDADGLHRGEAAEALRRSAIAATAKGEDN